jgi:phasin family protein
VARRLGNEIVELVTCNQNLPVITVGYRPQAQHQVAVSGRLGSMWFGPSIFHVLPWSMMMTALLPEFFHERYQSAVAAFFAMTEPFFDGVRDLGALNMDASREALAEYQHSINSLFEGHSTAERIAQQFGTSQQVILQFLSYGRRFAGIATRTQEAWTEAALARTSLQEGAGKAVPERL